METNYEAAELISIGQANDVVMGSGMDGTDLPLQSAPDFEFEED